MNKSRPKRERPVDINLEKEKAKLAISNSDYAPCYLGKYYCKTKGRGIYTKIPLQKNQFITYYHGLPTSKAMKTDDYIFEMPGRNRMPYYIDGTKEDESFGRLLNDSTSPNLKVMPVKDSNGVLWPCFFAKSKIEQGSPLEYNYNHNEKGDAFTWRKESPHECSFLCAKELSVKRQPEVHECNSVATDHKPLPVATDNLWPLPTKHKDVGKSGTGTFAFFKTASVSVLPIKEVQHELCELKNNVQNMAVEMPLKQMQLNELNNKVTVHETELCDLHQKVEDNTNKIKDLSEFFKEELVKEREAVFSFFNSQMQREREIFLELKNCVLQEQQTEIMNASDKKLFKNDMNEGQKPLTSIESLADFCDDDGDGSAKFHHEGEKDGTLAKPRTEENDDETEAQVTAVDSEDFDSCASASDACLSPVKKPVKQYLSPHHKSKAGDDSRRSGYLDEDSRDILKSKFEGRSSKSRRTDSVPSKRKRTDGVGSRRLAYLDEDSGDSSERDGLDKVKQKRKKGKERRKTNWRTEDKAAMEETFSNYIIGKTDKFPNNAEYLKFIETNPSFLKDISSPGDKKKRWRFQIYNLRNASILKAKRALNKLKE